MTYTFGDTVYLRTDPDKLERIVTGWTERPHGRLYLLSCGAMPESHHYDFEITNDKPTSNGGAGFKRQKR